MAWAGNPHRPFCGITCRLIDLGRWLDERYRVAGLEVVGIAYEEGTPMDQAQKVNRVRQRLQINYRLLLGSDRLIHSRDFGG